MREIARQDFAQVRDHRLVWAAFALVALLMLPSLLGGWRSVTAIVYNYQMYGVVLVAVLSVNAIVGERESNRIRLLLSLPGSRRDVFLAKLAVRTAMYLLVLAALMVLVALALTVGGGGVPAFAFLMTTLWMGLYGVAWTGFTIGVSAAFSSWFRSAAAVLVAYVILDPNLGIWGEILLPLLSFPFSGRFGTGAVSSLGTANTELWYQYVARLNPVVAFVEGPTADVWRLFPNLFSILVLMFFGTVPAIIGYWRFERADLG